jgi:predicted nucleic acid-binding protein
VTVVIDASLLLSIGLPLPYTRQSFQLLRQWKETGEVMHAPILLEYEITSALRKAVFLGSIGMDEAVSTQANLLSLGVQRVNPTPELHKHALQWAAVLGQSKAYDAHYLALAESLQADYWTADQQLVRGARQADADWVHWVGELNNSEAL